MKNIITIVSLTVLLTGCGLAKMNRASDDLEQSKAAYKSCLVAHPSTPASCASLRVAYEADIKAYQALGFQSQGYNIDVNQGQKQ